MTTPARDTVRATYRRMESAVEPMRKICCVCGVVLVEGSEPVSHGYCGPCHRRQLADLAVMEVRKLRRLTDSAWDRQYGAVVDAIYEAATARDL